MIKQFGAPAMPTVKTSSVFLVCFPLHEAVFDPPIGDHIEVPENREFGAAAPPN